MLIKPRWYQDEAVDSLFKYFDTCTGNPVIAAPTGTGKSIVIAMFLERVFRWWPDQRVLMLTHVKELIKQNAAKLGELWPTAPLGIYSAGLSRKEPGAPIVFGGVASVARNIKSIAYRDLIIIDECHLVSPKQGTMYQKIIRELTKINPALKVIGLSATPFRLGTGMLTDGPIFTDVCHDTTDFESFNRLIKEGYLAPLIPRRTSVQLEVDKVGLRGGEFIQHELAKAVDKKSTTEEAVSEMVELARDRNHWMIFTSSIDHCENVTRTLQGHGINATCVHSKISDKERDNRIKGFKAGQYQAMVNMGVLTTGFDFPQLDMIGMLRPTNSPALWVQMLGRGTRPHEGKTNCLVLDYAGNTERLGPINDPVITKKRKGKKGGQAPVKLCEECLHYAHASVRVCPQCLTPFPPPKDKLKTIASEKELILKSKEPKVIDFNVDFVMYSRRQGTGGKPDTLLVQYQCGIRTFQESVCLGHTPSNGYEHTSYPKHKANNWWRNRHDSEPPDDITVALGLAGKLKWPGKIRVWVNKKYPEIMGYYDLREPSESGKDTGGAPALETQLR